MSEENIGQSCAAKAAGVCFLRDRAVYSSSLSTDPDMLVLSGSVLLKPPERTFQGIDQLLDIVSILYYAQADTLLYRCYQTWFRLKSALACSTAGLLGWFQWPA